MNASSQCHDHSLTIFAHELRQPLSSILLAARAMLETTPADEGHQETMQSLGQAIARQGSYMARLIDGALQAPARARLREEWCDLNRIVHDAAESVSPVLRGRGHRLLISLPSRPVFLLADPLRVQQVLINLLGNAAKYTEPGGSVWLTVTEEADSLSIEVRDSGIGIAPTLLPRVFDLFEQGVRTPTDQRGGLGVGLAVVKTLVEEHGGRVTAHSEGTNLGATFVVRLPSGGALSGQRAVRVKPRETHVAAAALTLGNAMTDA